MRLHRIRLQNFRGVELSEVTFSTDGVTVIEGPNEVGKSSIAMALDLLLEHPDNADNKHTKPVKPLHRDAGPQVEAEFTTGGYHLVYSKRWFRKPETLLRVLAPERESLTGRQAHDRVIEILESTLDRALFRALRVVQGDRVEQPLPSASASLVAALDRAAAGTADPVSESSLWDAVLAERALFFTPSGQSIKRREELGKSAEAAERRVVELTAAIDAMVGEGEELDRVASQLGSLQHRRKENRAVLEEARTSWVEVEKLTDRLAPLDAERARAGALREAAASVSTQRHALCASVELAEQELVARREEAEIRTAAAARASAAESDAEAAWREAAARAEELASRLGVAEKDLAYRRAEIDCGDLGGRLDALQAAKEREAAALQFLGGCGVDEERRLGVQEAILEVTRARSALEVASPPVTVEALSDQRLLVNGEEQVLVAGSSLSTSAGERWDLEAPGILRVVVEAGSGVAGYARRLADAETRLAELVESCGLDASDPQTSLQRLLERRAVEERNLDAARAEKAEALRDRAAIRGELPALSEEQLMAMLSRARRIVEGYEDRRDAAFPLPPSIEAARSLAEELTPQVQDARGESEARGRELASLRDAARAANQDLRVAGELGADSLRRVEVLRSELETQRARRSDGDLEADITAADKALGAVEERAEGLRRDIESRDPDQLRIRLDNAVMLEQRCSEEIAELDGDRLRLEARLEARGNDDLQTQLEGAQREAETLVAERDSLERRARAVDRLFRTLARHRDAQLRAYVSPYRSEIEKLARYVYGEDTAVEVDPATFAIVSRTSHGVTVPFDSLSTGAREQLGIIARLACAILVNPAGSETGAAPSTSSGVPVILDDALGYSDPDRLRDLGVAFSVAAERAQIIVMTSTPGRYQWVGKASTVRLGGRAAP